MSELRDAILNHDDEQSEVVKVPEWGGREVLVKGMTGTSRARFLEQSFDAKSGKPKFERLYPEIIIACTYDPADGQRLFGLGDRDALNRKSAAATNRIAEVALRLSGLDPEARAEGKDDSDRESAEPTS